MIKQYSLTALQKAMNHALRLDPAMPEKLSNLQDKVLALVISPLNITFFMQFKDQHIYLLADYIGEPDTTIQSSPLGLIRLSLLPASKVRSLFNDEIRMTGDLALGQAVKALFDGLDIDWEGHLAHFTGDVVAHQIGSFFRQGLALKQRVSTSMRHNVTEYLQEELRVFPSREETNDFFSDIDELSLQSERLAAHVNQLLALNEIH